MSRKSEFLTLFGFHFATNQRLLDCAAKLKQAEYQQDSEYGHKSIHDILFHLLRANQGWRKALVTGQQHPPLHRGDFRDLATLQKGFNEERSAWMRLLDSFSEEQFEAEINVTSLRGESGAFPLWRILQHLLLHGMQHHAEIGQLLTVKGQSPGNIDFIFYS